MSKQGTNTAKRSLEGTGTQNLFRDSTSGRYYARWKIRGKRQTRSLETTVLSVARARLRDVLSEVDAVRGASSGIASGDLTLEDCINAAIQRVQSDPDLKPRGKEHWVGAIRKVEKTWPESVRQPIGRAARLVPKWFDDFRTNGTAYQIPGTKTVRKGNSVSSTNKAAGAARRIFEVAVEAGAIPANPVDRIKGRYRAAKQKKLDMPGRDQFKAMVEAARTHAGGKGRQQSSAEMIEFLAYGGFRLGEARAVQWGHVNLGRGIIRVEGGKTDAAARNVPIIPAMEDLLKRMKERRELADEGLDLSDSVLAVGECQKTLTRACEQVGVNRLTHHDLRHYFATICIESGVDIPTVSRWMGHKDGGALAMKIYGHLRDDHSLEQARRVAV